MANTNNNQPRQQLLPNQVSTAYPAEYLSPVGPSNPGVVERASNRGRVLPVDGLLQNGAYRPRQYDWFSMAMAGSEVHRRANLLRPYIAVVPDSSTTLIGPRDTYEKQVQVPGGSYLIGGRYIECTDQGLTTEKSTVNALIQITDCCTGIKLYADYTGAEVLRRKGWSSYPGNFKDYLLPVPLSQPVLIQDPGLVNVEISSTLTSTNLYCQLTLWFDIPCTKLIGDQTTQTVSVDFTP